MILQTNFGLNDRVLNVGFGLNPLANKDIVYILTIEAAIEDEIPLLELFTNLYLDLLNCKKRGKR
jgi:hypothetical protein